MSHTKAFTTGAAIAVLAGMLLLPGGTFARGAGGFAAGHGPVFGVHPHGGHPPFRLARRHPSPFGLHLWNRHLGHRGIGAIYPGADSGTVAADPNDVTGTLPPPGPGFFAPPAAPPAEHIGCLSRGYDVPGESGGAARVVVTRC